MGIYHPETDTGISTKFEGETGYDKSTMPKRTRSLNLTWLVINPVEILLSIFSFLDSLALVPVLKFHPGIYFLLIVLLVIQAQLEMIQGTAVFIPPNQQCHY
ncbi:hypothetical protein KQX54_011928 [Cotesia glomerata]|uniref:Uncharacterized protein n=1 Tax=Cotesia glomerata TaxID=32391 RepID=A0AAV7J0F8_COTGL|nr:hypothetical protein KQX54_011928 [Cotesia glomerata]